MGSQLTKNFEIQNEVKSEGGIASPWKIYSATRRDREKTPVSIFIFEKKDKKPEIVLKLKNEVNSLLKLRHPNILQILEPILEDANSITWIAEPIQFCLGDLLRKPAVLSTSLSDTETRLGILDIIQGLSFLHNDARLVHGSVCPDNIYISTSGKWKLGGLTFSANYTQDTPAQLDPGLDILQSSKVLKFQSDVDRISPLAFYTAPEVIQSGKLYPGSDLFSLGCSIFAIYKAFAGEEMYLLNINDFSLNGYLNACRIALANSSSFAALPEGLAEIIVKLLSMTAAKRGSLHELSISKSLQTPYVKTIYYLEHLQEKQDGQKVQFFKGLTSIISKFDKVIMNKRLLPALVSNMQHPNLTPYILPSILTILRNCEITPSLYQLQIWPGIQRLITGKEIPAQSFYLILSEIDVLIKYTELDPCKKVLMPLVFRGYDCAVGEIQTAIMEKTPDLIKELKDFTYVRQQLLPRFLQGIVNSKISIVKETGLKALSLIFPLFDRPTMVEIIIPSLEKFKKFDITGNMVMHLLTVYEGISKALGHKTTSVNILPALLPLLVEAELTKTEFDRLYESMTTMMKEVKEARYGELSENKEEQIVENLKNEEIEEVNEIFKDIFDVSGKPILEAPVNVFAETEVDGLAIKGLESFELRHKAESVKNTGSLKTGGETRKDLKNEVEEKSEKKEEVRLEKRVKKESESDDLFAELASRPKEEFKKGPMNLKGRAQDKVEENKAVKFVVKKTQPVSINTDDFFNEFLK